MLKLSHKISHKKNRPDYKDFIESGPSFFTIPVLDDAGRGDAPLHHLGGELVVVAEVREADDVVARLAVLDEHDGGDDLDPQPLREEGALLGVDLDKLGLQVLLGQDPEVLVHNLWEGAPTLSITPFIHRILETPSRHLEKPKIPIKNLEY